MQLNGTESALSDRVWKKWESNRLEGIKTALAKLYALPSGVAVGWVKGQIRYFERVLRQAGVDVEALKNGSAGECGIDVRQDVCELPITGPG